MMSLTPTEKIWITALICGTIFAITVCVIDPQGFHHLIEILDHYVSPHLPHSKTMSKA